LEYYAFGSKIVCCPRGPECGSEKLGSYALRIEGKYRRKQYATLSGALSLLMLRGSLRILTSINSERRSNLEIIASILDACRYLRRKGHVMCECNMSSK
jgi:hypothetical protein